MWSVLLAAGGAVIMLAACGYALLKGDRPARLCGIVIAVGWAGSFLLQDRQNILAPQYLVAALDGVLCLVFFALTLTFRRIWLMVATASQLLTAFTHVAFFFDSRIVALGFMTAYYVWSYVTLGALVWGTRIAEKHQATGPL
jgi:hypothetical protein